MKQKIIARDISWLSFNDRVLQEAADSTVPLQERIKFLGIVSNNLDEFFRVRVAALKTMVEMGSKAKMHLETNPADILTEIQNRLLQQQDKFHETWMQIKTALQEQNIFLVTETQLNAAQKDFVYNYFSEEVRSFIVPLMVESLRELPVLNDKSIYLACTLSKADNSLPVKFALISVPTRHLPRFVLLPQHKNKKYVMLLEDVVRLCLPKIFSFFGYDKFSAHIIKVTRDAEFDIDNDVSTTFIEKIEKGIKKRRKGKPVRFIYDKDINIFLLTYLKKRLNLRNEHNIIPGGRIHNFKDFMDFPAQLFEQRSIRKKSFVHPALQNSRSITEQVLAKDILLHFPYHSFESVIDLLREAAIDPRVTHIKITAYRLAPRSKIIHALTNAVRNGKIVTVMLELRARFEEEANLQWKAELEEAGVIVLLGIPNMKVHAKLCIIRRKNENKIQYYGFVSTGNLNEKTAKFYGDHLLLTAAPAIMADVNRIFLYLEKPKERSNLLRDCKTILTTPVVMRRQLMQLIDREIRNAKADRKAVITLKLNSLSDAELALRLSDAAKAGVKINMVIRGICCMMTENPKYKKKINAVSIVDEYLEHARLMIFHNDGKEKMYISSADWMVRNLDHRIEAACPIMSPEIKQELKDLMKIQLNANVKARILDNEQKNEYKQPEKEVIRSQEATYQYLQNKIS